MKQTVLITGATSGIGLSLAKQFGMHGYNLILVARDTKAVEQKARELTSEYNIHTFGISADLSDEKAPQTLFDTLKRRKIVIDILVNNAGFGMYGDFVTIDVEKHLNLIDLNIKALTALTRLFLPAMIERKKGKILNTASTAAFQPGPHMAVYYATKAYVLSLSEALSSELQSTGVTVTALCPGPTKTGFETGASMGRTKLFKFIKQMNPDEVAKIGFDGLMRNKIIVIPGFLNNFLAFGNRLVPRKLSTYLSRQALE